MNTSSTSTDPQAGGSIVGQALAGAAPGTRFQGYLPVGTMASGAPIRLAFAGIKGARPGPCLWANGHVHGVEMNGVFSALDFLNSVDPAQLSGTLIVTASANPLAMDARRKTAPQDENDLDQTFPGRADGFISERMAAALFEEARQHADMFVSLHTNGADNENHPYAVYKCHPNGLVAESELLRLQSYFEPSVCCRMSIEPGRGELLGHIAGAIDYQMLALGIPSFMLELGGGSRAEPAHISLGVRGLFRVARHMGMLPPAADDAPPTRVRRGLRRRHFTSNHGGLFRANLRPGNVVRAGEPLATLMDLHGQRIETLSLPHDVLVLSIRRDPVVHTGDRYLFAVEEWDEVEVGAGAS